MTKAEDVLLVSREIIGPIVDVGAAAAKAMPPGRRYRYSQAVRYTQEDGQTIDSTEKAMTKPKLQAEHEADERMIAKRCMFAMYRDGQYVGIVTRMTIHLGGNKNSPTALSS